MPFVYPRPATPPPRRELSFQRGHHFHPCTSSESHKDKDAQAALIKGRLVEQEAQRTILEFQERERDAAWALGFRATGSYSTFNGRAVCFSDPRFNQRRDVPISDKNPRYQWVLRPAWLRNRSRGKHVRFGVTVDVALFIEEKIVEEHLEWAQDLPVEEKMKYRERIDQEKRQKKTMRRNSCSGTMYAHGGMQHTAMPPPQYVYAQQDGQHPTGRYYTEQELAAMKMGFTPLGPR